MLHAIVPGRGEVAAFVNQAAWECGVRPGMPLAEAKTLLAHRPRAVSARRSGGARQAAPPAAGGEPVLLPHDPAADRAALARLAEHCERFSPLVGWETAGEQDSKFKVQTSKFKVQGSDESDCLFLEVTGIGRLFGGEAALAQEVVADLARLGYEARVAIAGTIGTAWALAHATASWEVHDPAAGLPENWSLALLRLPDETLALFAQLGLAELGQLRALPRASLRARFGEAVLLRLDQLTGAAQETIVPHRPPPEFAAQQVLEHPLERGDLVERLLRDLVEQLAGQLAPRRCGATRLTCRLDCAPGRPLVLEAGLCRPSAHPQHLWDVLRMRLEQTPLPGPVGRLTLTAAAAPLENRQRELFGGSRQEAARQLHLLIDRLSSRLGPQAVLRPERTADPLPERAVRYVPWVEGPGPRPRKATPKTGFSAASHPQRPALPLVRPLVLETAPRPLAVLAIAPDGPPVSFRLGKEVCQVARYWGPERIEAGWWRGRSVRRDYYRVEMPAGRRYWIFRRLTDGVWHLHGRYE